jgi:magnesium transporter
MFLLGYEDGKQVSLSPGEVKEFLLRPSTQLWVDIEAPTTEDYLFLTHTFPFHPLAIEDCKHFSLPKLEEYDDYLFVVFHKIIDKQDTVDRQEIDFFLGKNYLVSVRNNPSSIIEARKVQYSNKHLPVDGLLHNILDSMVDNYLLLIDKWDEQLDSLEDAVMGKKNVRLMQSFLNLKNKLAEVRKTVTLQREVISKLSKNEYVVISKKTRIYFRDVYDHIVSFYNDLEVHREILASLFEAHISLISVQRTELSHRMNRTMERLAIVSMIFLPLTFITNIYGMNFEYIPGTGSLAGFFILVAALLISAYVVFHFMRKVMHR